MDFKRYLIVLLTVAIAGASASAASAQTKVGAEFVVATPASVPSAARLKNGGFVVAWSDTAYARLVCQLYDSNATPVGGTIQVTPKHRPSQQMPRVFGLSNGRFVFLWTDYRGKNRTGNVEGQVFEPSGVPASSQFTVNTYTTNDQADPAVAALSDGAFVVVWHSRMQDGSKRGVYGQIFDGAGNKLGAEFRVNTRTANDQYDPAVALIGTGGFVVTYHSINGQQTGTYAQIFNASGQRVGSEFRVGDGSSALVAADSEKVFVVAWQPSEHQVTAQRFTNAGAKLGAAIQIANMPASTIWFQALRRLATGDLVFAWSSTKPQSQTILGRRYGPLGVARGSTFVIASSNTVSVGFPSIAPLLNGTYAAVWAEGNQAIGQLFR